VARESLRAPLSDVVFEWPALALCVVLVGAVEVRP